MMEKHFWPLQENAIGEEEINAVIDFLKSSDRYTKGSKCKEFEEKWSARQGCKFSVFVNSGSSANLILVDALKELYNWKDGDKVLVPAVTWPTNISPIIQLNLKPMFVDVNKKTLSFDVAKVKETIAKEENIVGMFITHLLGIPAEIEELKKLCEEKNIKVFEDCCEAIGAHSNGKAVGNFGEGSTFSFYFGHHMSTIEGGMVCTDNFELYKLLLLKRSHGLARELPPEDFEKIKQAHPDIHPLFLFSTHGYNVRNHEICAVIGLEQLKKLDTIIAKRNANFDVYHKICQAHEDKVHLVKKDGVSAFSLPFIFKQKELFEKFKVALTEKRIEFRPIISGNLLRQPFLSNFPNEDKVVADMIHDHGVYIGNNQFINTSQLNVLEEIFKNLK